MAKKERRARIVCLSLSCLLLGLNISTVKAEALPEVMSGSSTVADCVMSYYAMSGSAVANSDFINTLYNDLGSDFGTVYDLAENGMLTLNQDGTWQATAELTQAIEETSAYTSLGLDQVFNISAEEAAAGGGVAAASGAATLSGAIGGVASTGLLPVLGGVTVAYWGGIALGTLIAHKVGLYGKPIEQGTYMTTSEILEKIPNGSSSLSLSGSSAGGVWNRVYYTNGNMIWVNSIYNYADYGIVYINGYNGRHDINFWDTSLPKNPYTQTLSFSDGYAQLPSNGGGNATYPIGNYSPMIKSNYSYSQYVSALKRGEEQFPKKHSPDMIGENGNLQGQYESNSGYSVPDMKPQIDPGTQAGKPLTLQDWLDFANAVSNNNNNTDPVGNNKNTYTQIIERIVVPNPNPNPDPDPDPDPNPNPDPYTPPVVTPVPDPSLPDPVPDQNMSEEPQQSENPQETEKPLEPIPTGKPWMLPDLTKKFPFCIPWDIASCFTLLKSNVRQAPYISWHFVSPVGHVDYTFNLDLSDFDDAATLLRTLELIAFIVGLAFATRYLIGAT